MLSIRTAAFLLLPLLSSIWARADAAADKRAFDAAVATAEGKAAFQELLNALPEESIHAALHDQLYPKFQDGVFQFDRNAIEEVHEQNPPLATALISAAAKLELAKRQATNTTAPVTSETSPATSDAPPATLNNPPATSDVAPTSAQISTPAAPATSDAQPPASSSAVSLPVSSGAAASPEPSEAPPSSALLVLPVTTTDSAGSTVTTSEFVIGDIVTSVDAAGSQVVITTPAATTDRPETRTDSRGNTFVTTVTPSGGRVTSVVLQTRTNADGSLETITQYTVVGGATGSAGPSAGNPAQTTGAGVPGLQASASRLTSGNMFMEIAAAFAAAVGFRALLL